MQCYRPGGLDLWPSVRDLSPLPPAAPPAAAEHDTETGDTP